MGCRGEKRCNPTHTGVVHTWGYLAVRVGTLSHLGTPETTTTTKQKKNQSDFRDSRECPKTLPTPTKRPDPPCEKRAPL